MPALFIGHGSPMNVIEDNGFTRRLRKLGQELSRPKAILVVSAHWETGGTRVLTHKQPETMYDFYGFPDALYATTYPAPGAPAEARLAIEALKGISASSTEDRGLDHGAWAVLYHLFPKADIPVFQVSLDRKISFQEHFAVGKMLSSLREKGIMILGSGNIVHNLGRYHPDVDAEPFDWAVEFDDKIKALLVKRDMAGLIHIEKSGAELAKLAMPTAEHYLPLLYVLGASDAKDALSFPYEGMQNASMSMRMVLLNR
ncbi:MAG: 4,5-DOPA dioxygenase extradiol [Candidatus Omnitrophica bacterium]|nr:4,5-DOPA dioxygenase extradiol [Candidatus Omnitrophota bacterium]